MIQFSAVKPLFSAVTIGNVHRHSDGNMQVCLTVTEDDRFLIDEDRLQRWTRSRMPDRKPYDYADNAQITLGLKQSSSISPQYKVRIFPGFIKDLTNHSNFSYVGDYADWIEDADIPDMKQLIKKGLATMLTIPKKNNDIKEALTKWVG